jgi:hypothetical protein
MLHHVQSIVYPALLNCHQLWPAVIGFNSNEADFSIVKSAATVVCLPLLVYGCCASAVEQSFRSIDTLKPGESMACQGLFISCLFDAAEHKTETYQVCAGHKIRNNCLLNAKHGNSSRFGGCPCNK